MAQVTRMPHRIAPSALLPNVISIAREAGRAIMDVYRDTFEVQYKDDASPLTQADLAAHRVIRHALRALTPDVPVLSEEQAHAPYETRRSWPLHWLVDPLDGTRDFVARSDEFSVNIALLQGERPLLGVIHAPVDDVTYSGGVGIEARRSHGAGSGERIAVAVPQADELVVMTSRRHRDDGTSRFIAELRERYAVEVRQRGSALKACAIAEGSAHLYVRMGPTWEWDTAASQALLEAAGGVLCQAGSAAPLRYNKADLRNPPFYAAYGRAAPHP